MKGEVSTWRRTAASRTVPAGPVVLTVDIAAERTTPAALDGRHLSTEVAGGFTGRVSGGYAASGTVRFDWFDYRPAADRP